MFRQAVAIGRKALGNEHPQLAGYLNNLAVFSQEQVRLAGFDSRTHDYP